MFDLAGQHVTVGSVELEEGVELDAGEPSLHAEAADTDLSRTVHVRFPPTQSIYLTHYMSDLSARPHQD